MDTKKLTKLDEKFVSNELSLMGFDVKKIKRSAEDERPDFIVKDDSVSYKQRRMNLPAAETAGYLKII